MDLLVIVPPVLGGVALLFAAILAGRVARQDAGTDRMKEIAAFIHEGAQAFLKAEYKILLFFVAVLFVLIGFGISWITAIALAFSPVTPFWTQSRKWPCACFCIRTASEIRALKSCAHDAPLSESARKWRSAF